MYENIDLRAIGMTRITKVRWLEKPSSRYEEPKFMGNRIGLYKPSLEEKVDPMNVEEFSHFVEWDWLLKEREKVVVIICLKLQKKCVRSHDGRYYRLLSNICPSILPLFVHFSCLRAIYGRRLDRAATGDFADAAAIIRLKNNNRRSRQRLWQKNK
jgi:hypothetical protein